MNKLDLELFEILDSEIWESPLILDLLVDKKSNRKIETWRKDYPTTNTVLRYILSRPGTSIRTYSDYEGLNFIVYDKEELYKLDITKEIINYTDEQKQELINFLKTL